MVPYIYIYYLMYMFLFISYIIYMSIYLVINMFVYVCCMYVCLYVWCMIFWRGIYFVNLYITMCFKLLINLKFYVLRYVLLITLYQIFFSDCPYLSVSLSLFFLSVSLFLSFSLTFVPSVKQKEI